MAKPIIRSSHGEPRISMPMNIYTWEDEILEVLPGLGTPRYEPVPAIQFHTSITSKYYGDHYAVTEESN